MLCGYPPFRGDTDQEILLRVKIGKFEFDGEEWDNISADSKDIISKCLILDASKRISAEEMLSHPWFSKNIVDVKPIINNKKFLKN